jgi:hypothetical protein
VEKPEGKRPPGRPKCRLKEDDDDDDDNNNTALKEMGWEGRDWIHLAHDRDKWQTLVNKVLNILVPQNAGNF